ncbi:hypothetical protein FACS189459_6100 [Bacilli bacterium]|nr:hypothetical protein FACS189459_6100 [Bacilli bacterium]GHU52020.1 hypothetical protein FACS189496_1430 [Bacilli bacterium]
MSDENEHIVNFVIDGDVDFGFLIDPDMDCHIFGINNATVQCNTVENNKTLVGVICGRIDTNPGEN